MSFARTATLNISGQSYDLMYFYYGFSRDTDYKGRPSSGICGGMISLTMESTKSTELLGQFLNSDRIVTIENFKLEPVKEEVK